MDETRGGAPPRLFRTPSGIEWPLFALALILRLAWAFTATTELWADHIFNDVTGLHLSRGLGFTASTAPPYDPAIFRTPGYPAFLAVVYAVFGHSVRAAFVVQAVLDGISCLLLGRMARETAGPAVGRWTLLLAATFPFTIHAVGTLSPESLLVFMALLFLQSLRSIPLAGGWIGVVATGVVYGLLCWVKPVFLPVPGLLFLAERARGRSWAMAAGRAAVAGCVGLVLFLPWVLRNHAAFGRPVLAGELGLVVWHGTRDFSPETPEEIRVNLARTPADPEERWEATRRSYTDSHRLLREDHEFLERGLEAIREHPVRAFLLDPLRRIPRLWISVRHVQFPGWVGTLAATAGVGYLLLGLVGIFLLRGRLGELSPWWVLPVALTLAYAALHAEARYTLPARSALLFLDGVALSALWERWRARQRAASAAPYASSSLPDSTSQQ